MEHDPSDGERLLQPHEERHGSARRNPSGSVLQPFLAYVGARRCSTHDIAISFTKMHRKARNGISWCPFERQLNERLHQKLSQLAKTGFDHTKTQEASTYANYYLAQ